MPVFSERERERALNQQDHFSWPKSVFGLEKSSLNSRGGEGTNGQQEGEKGRIKREEEKGERCVCVLLAFVRVSPPPPSSSSEMPKDSVRPSHENVDELYRHALLPSSSSRARKCQQGEDWCAPKERERASQTG